MPAIGAEASTSMSAAGNANLKAIDISQYNVTKDSSGNYLYNKFSWSSIKSNANVVYIRASIKDSSGTLAADLCYKTLAASAQSAGISHGFYHYFRPSTNASKNIAQADYFYNAIKNYGYDCVPVLDVEDAYDCGGTSPLTKAQVTSAVKAFADEFKSKSGQDIMIYTYNAFIDKYFETSLSKYKLWVANWTSSGPYTTSVWSSWDMWQYTDTLTVSGIPVSVDGNKATSNIYVNSSSGVTWADLPSGTYGKGNITVSGWAVSHYGVTRVDIYIDGKGAGSVYKEDFTERGDIEDKFGGGGYDDALNSGYKYTIADGSLSNGTHTVRIAAVDGRGNAVWSSAKTFTVNIPANKINLDKPSGTYAGNVTVSGWAISAYGVKRVDIYVDGKGITSVSNASMTERADIVKLFGKSGYTDLAHSGFSYTIPDGTLTGGTHTVRVAVIDNKGRALWSAQKTITVKVPADLIHLDSPSGTYTGNISVSGWAISNFGIKRVDIYVDGKGTGSVLNASLTERTDIERIFANRRYNDLAHSGFSYTIESGSLSAGKHVIRVAAVDSKGNAVWSSQSEFTVKVPGNQMHLDSPSGTYSGDVTVSGWAISYYGIRRVDIYVDGKGMGSVLNASFTQRSDVENLYRNSGYNDLTHSGFSYTIADGTLSSGTHTIRVAEIDNSGQVLWSPQKTFEVS